MVFDWLFPKRCVGCQKEGSYFCFNCQKQLQLIESFVCPGCNQPVIAGHTHPACQRQTGLSGLTTIFKYNFLARRLIHKLKYRLVPEAARVLTQKTLNGLDHQPIFSYFFRSN